MKKIFVLFLFALTLSACGGDKDECIDSCKLSLSLICGDDQTTLCSEACNSDDSEVFNCVIGANDCEDIEDKKTVCFSKPESSSIDTENLSVAESNPTCESVCQKYSTCAGFG